MWRFQLKRIVRVTLVLTFVCAIVPVCSHFAQAQKIDLAFGVSTIDAPGASAADSNHSPVSLTGGAYTGFSGDVLFFHNLGIGGEIYWKDSQGTYAAGTINATPFRPLFWDFNAVYSPKLASHVYLEAVAGIGAQSTRFYCGASCFDPYSGTNYVSVNHFLGDFGGGVKLYPTNGGFFVRPEARVYLVHNDQEFSSVRATRYGVSIGYTFERHPSF